MPSTADELAALRKQGSVRALASNLSAVGGALSTPDAEKEAIETRLKGDKLGAAKAKELLNKGSKGAVQASAAQAAKISAQKKSDLEKKAQAAALLQKGGSAYSQQEEHAFSQTGKKKAEWEKKNATKMSMATGIGQTKAGKKAARQAPMADKNGGQVNENVSVEAESSAAKEKSAPAPVEKKAPVDDPVDDPVETADDDVPQDDPTTDFETATDVTQQTNPPEGASKEEERPITNRNEKKARKMMTRLGMRPVSNIARVTLKAGGGRGYFFIDRPDVFTSVGGKVDTYVIFGEAKQGGAGGMGGGNAAQAQAQAAMAQQQAAMAAANATGGAKGMPSVTEDEDEDVPELTNEEGGGSAANENGVDAKDIDLVMSQASCSRAKAVSALKENDGDLVNAIMSLTT